MFVRTNGRELSQKFSISTIALNQIDQVPLNYAKPVSHLATTSERDETSERKRVARLCYRYKKSVFDKWKCTLVRWTENEFSS